MLQILSTRSYLYEVLNPTNGELVDGSDRLYIESLLCLKLLTARILDYREQLERGSEQSTNFRWWDLASSQWFFHGREDLKHPPTAVGGIWTFCAKPYGSLRGAERFTFEEFCVSSEAEGF